MLNLPQIQFFLTFLTIKQVLNLKKHSSHHFQENQCHSIAVLFDLNENSHLCNAIKQRKMQVIKIFMILSFSIFLHSAAKSQLDPIKPIEKEQRRNFHCSKVLQYINLILHVFMFKSQEKMQ